MIFKAVIVIPFYVSIFLTFCQGEAVKLISLGKAPSVTQPTEGATYDPMMKKENAKVWRCHTRDKNQFKIL